jgi:hypothetical protein
MKPLLLITLSGLAITLSGAPAFADLYGHNGPGGWNGYGALPGRPEAYTRNIDPDVAARQVSGPATAYAPEAKPGRPEAYTRGIQAGEAPSAGANDRSCEKQEAKPGRPEESTRGVRTEIRSC